MTVVLLPENVVAQKLNRDALSDYCVFIKEKVEVLYSQNTKEYILQDGCPYANGELHLGHFLNKTLKDFYIKYNLIHGYKVRVSFGWDCHGLPIENKARFMEGDLLENCANIALKYKAIQSDTLSLFGIFSTENDYLTLSNDFVQREVAIYNQLKNSGLVFQKSKPTWYSPTLKTVLANSEIEYKDVTDESLYFKYHAGNETYFLVWTTTEWTVDGNQAICVNPNIRYCITSDGLICSERFAKENGFTYKEERIADRPFYVNHKDEICPILLDEFVSDTETGIVHLSGGHGDEDYNVLVKHGITPKNVVDNLHGDLAQHIATFKVKDEFVFKRVPVTHSYPVDWRVKEKVVKVLTEQTYLEFDWHKIKTVVKQIKLSGKDRTRLEGMLFSRKDWCLSRQRKWGVPIPDSSDILDVWFDSGTVFSMYDKPADLYIEGIDQHRGWFQSSIIIASMIDRVPTKRILTHGFVVDEIGNKLAKSEGNFRYLNELYDEYNPDVMRLWVLLSDYRNEIVFSEDSIKSAGKQYFRLRNFTRYLINNLHREQHAMVARAELVSKIDSLKESIKNDINNFELNKALRSIVLFTNEYSSYLTEDMKNKFYEADIASEFRVNMENELYYVAKSLIEILFPFLPFLSAELEIGANSLAVVNKSL